MVIMTKRWNYIRWWSHEKKQRAYDLQHVVKVDKEFGENVKAKSLCEKIVALEKLSQKERKLLNVTEEVIVVAKKLFAELKALIANQSAAECWITSITTG